MRVPAFYQAILVILVAYLIFANAFPPVLPQTLMIQYMAITVVGVLLYYSFDDARWAEFMSPIRAVLRDDGKGWLRVVFLVSIPLLAGWITYTLVRLELEAPVELRQVHPAPPSSLKLDGRRYDLTRLQNPIREAVIEQFASDREGAMAAYADAVRAGRDVYYQNCFFCHGDLLDGDGHFSEGFTNPLPANFQDVGTIAQLEEAFLFWRINTGGPGLPGEGTPWNSAMPVWHEYLDENEVWQVIIFLYDYVGQVPRIWDQDKSRVATEIKDQLARQRSKMTGKPLYQFRCAVCHGDEGLGDGPAAELMYPRPRDFGLGLFKYKTTPGALPPSDADLVQTISAGLTGTAMPGWAKLLSKAQIESLVPVIKGFDFAATWPPEDADDSRFDSEGRYTGDDFIAITEREPVAGQVAYGPESVARGEEVFAKACNECHGEDARGNITSGKRLEDDWGYRIWPRDLTKPWTYRVSDVRHKNSDEARKLTVQRIYERLSIGITGTPMPAHRAVEEGNQDPLSLEDRWHVANYVYSLREDSAPPPSSDVLSALKLEKIPESFDSELWQQANPVTYRLVPNIVKGERHFTPLADAITVRAIYDETDIAFLLEVNDRTDSRPGEEVSEGIQDSNLVLYPDALALQLPQQEAFSIRPVVVKPFYRHGDKGHPTTIWYWNAGSIEPQRAASAVLFDASGPDQPLVSRAQGDLSANGGWRQGQWKVMFTRPRHDPGDQDVSFDEGRFIPISFANWDGSNGEVGSRHTLTSWYWLVLPPEADMARIVGVPALVAIIIFAALLLLVRTQRKQAREDSS